MAKKQRQIEIVDVAQENEELNALLGAIEEECSRRAMGMHIKWNDGWHIIFTFPGDKKRELEYAKLAVSALERAWTGLMKWSYAKGVAHDPPKTESEDAK